MIVTLTGVAHGGYAVGRVDGRVVFVSGGIPGEEVEVALTRETARYAFATVTDVISASPDRRPHVWEAAERHGVGGADLGHMEISAQRAWKETVIADSLTKVGGAEVVRAVADAVGDIHVRSLSDGVRGTRTRVSFVVDEHRRLAMRKPKSHETVALQDMPLAVPELAELAVFDEAWQPYLTPGETVTAVWPSASAAVLVTAAGVMRAPGVRARREVRETIRSRQGVHRYTVDARGFWQVHREAPRALTEAVIAGASLAGGERVMELYSGAGLLTAPLAAGVGARGTVRAVESTGRAHKAAQRNVPAPNVEHIKGKVSPRALTGDIDVVVLDPPRTGAGQEIARAIVESSASSVVYVACDPVALARDLKILCESFSVADFQALDMFEHTHHVESVAVLRR